MPLPAVPVLNNCIMLRAGIILVLCTLISCGKKTQEAVPAAQPDTFEIVELQTDYGNMYIWLYDSTPLHKKNFLKLASESFYDGTTFHRIIPNFMIQGGDPLSKDSNALNDGTGGPGYTIPAEIHDSIRHKRGVLAAARLSDAVNPTRASSGSQFYICVSTSGTQHLNGLYTAFGYVMKGMEYADSVVRQPRDNTSNRPLKDQKMYMRILKKTRAQIADEYGYMPEF